VKIKNNNKIIRTLFFSLFIISLVLPIKTFSFTPIELILEPEYPSANQTVSAKIEIYGLEIDKYKISWLVNGKLIEQGIGQKEFFFQTGGWGSSTTLTIQVNTQEKGQIQKQIKITPTDVSLIWEAETYTPPFYKGKAVNSSNSIINVTAVPNFIDRDGKTINYKNLIYNWKEDGKVKGSQSGYGKSTFSFEGPQITNSKDITVEVESLNKTLVVIKTISIRSNKPKIVFYEEDPLLGTLYNKAIENKFNLNSEELKVKASPFFFSPQDEIKYKWIVDNQTINNLENQITLRRPLNQTGLSQISLKIQNMDSILQFVDNNFSINYE